MNDTRRKRLLYQAQHRGFKEADIVVGGFAAAELAAMSEAELDAFEAFLAHADAEIYAWYTGEKAPPPDVDAALVRRFRAFDAARITAP